MGTENTQYLEVQVDRIMRSRLQQGPVKDNGERRSGTLQGPYRLAACNVYAKQR